ncbi:MAG: hypothetical protein JWN83_757 [Chitinophagaceae bacterium]|nr:hypothetical protein [Chitinophagaceae bacterium]
MKEENQFEIKGMILKYLRNELDANEKRILDEWIHSSSENGQFFQEFTDERTLKKELTIFQDIAIEAGRKKLYKKMEWDSKIRPMNSWLRYAVAASVLLLLSTGAYFVFFNKEQKQAKTEIAKDVEAPKATKAIITLGNGKQILLDSVNSGTLATQGNVNIVKTADGKIIYSGTTDEMVSNTLTNPRGSNVVDMTLADGSHVWLNSGSSVTYPVAFAGNERKVQITGEAYFEVTHNAAMPFVVEKNDVSVHVLGTHFNVNTYDDESVIKVTLIEGSVKVSRANISRLLKPGQQAQLNNKEIKIEDTNIEEVMAWKNGLFSFNKANIQTVLRQLGRWYDVDVVFEGKVPAQLFGGEIQRNIQLSKVLESLEKNGVRFRIENKKIVVLK